MTQAVIILAGLGCVLAFAAAQHGAVLPQDWNLCLVIIAALAASLWLHMKPGQPAPPLPLVLSGAALLLLALAAVQVIPLPIGAIAWLSPSRIEAAESLHAVSLASSAMTLSALPSATMPHLIRCCAYLLVLLMVRELAWRTTSSPWVVCLPLVLVAAGEGGLGVLQNSLVERGDGVPGTFVNRNHFAGLLAICLPFCLAMAIASFQMRRRKTSCWAVECAIGVAAATLAYAGILASLSRAGFLVATCATGLVAIVVLSAAEEPGVRKIGLFAPAGMALLGMFLFLPSAALVERFAALTDAGQMDLEFRVGLWKDTLSLIADYPWFGCGLGAFRAVFSSYKSNAPHYDVDYAHNDYLQVLAEVGLLGAFSVALFVGAAVILLLRRLWRADNPDELGISIACLAALVAIGLHSFVDFNLYIPSNSLAVAWTLGIALRP